MWILSDKPEERNAPGIPKPYTNVVKKKKAKVVRNKVAAASGGTGPGSAATKKP
jgi:hypothetical protein